MNKTIGYVGLQRKINGGYISEFLLLQNGKIVFQCFGLMGYNQPPRSSVGIGGYLSSEMLRAFDQVSDGVLTFLFNAYEEILESNARPVTAGPYDDPGMPARKTTLPAIPARQGENS